jgi:hypothetical protein
MKGYGMTVEAESLRLNSRAPVKTLVDAASAVPSCDPRLPATNRSGGGTTIRVTELNPNN